MYINSKTYLVLIEIIHRIKMLKESITYQEKIRILAWQFAFMYDKVAFSFIRLIEILFWVYFKNVVAHLESDWLNFWCDFFTGFLYIAECLVCFAIKLRESGLPLLSNFFKNIRWDAQL